MAKSDICPVCKNPKSADTSGSLTQWINLCSCDLITDETDDVIEVRICGLCGKRIAEGRAGSFTQYIFRSDKCECPEPQPRTEKRKIDQTTTTEITEDLEDEIELELENNSFPASRYKPLALLGQGVTGSVYLARDRLLNKKVAIKILTSFDPEKLISFQDEARATSQLKHESIVALLDFGVSEDNTPYMVMEYLQGETLEELLFKERTLDLETCKSLFSQLTSALSLAHKKNIYHRDLNLRNIILVPKDNQYQVKIIDFGLASWKKTDGSFSGEQNENIVGTPFFMSPDQGLGKTYDARSETYSIGCIMFNALTGSPPFSGENAIQTLSFHANETPPKLEDNCEETFPQELEDLVQKALAKDPDHRFQSMEELKESLLSIEETIQAEPITKRLVEKPKKIDKNLVLISGSFILVFLVGAAMIFGQFKKSQKEFNPSKHTIKKTTKKDDIPEIKTIEDSAAESGYLGKKWELEGNMMKGVEVTDEDFKDLKMPPKCTFINLWGGSMNVTGAGLKYLVGTKLSKFQSSAPSFSDKGAYYLTKFPGIKVINIQTTEKLTEKGIKYLASIPSLEHLQLRFMILPEKTTEILSTSKSIRSLDFGHSRSFTGEDIANLAKIKKLKRLSLADIGLKDSWLEPFTKSNLKRLEIHENKITDKGLRILARVKTLRRLKITADENITEAGFKDFQSKRPECKIQRVGGSLIPQLNLETH